MQTNPGPDFIALGSAIFTGCAALAAAAALWFSAVERKTNMKKDFILWAMERLREKDLRESRGLLFSLSATEIEEVEKAIRGAKRDDRADQIRQVCLAFDEIGYFVYKMGLVQFRDILDIYPQTIKIWNKIPNIIGAWRDIEGSTAFVYFEMLARQTKLGTSPQFEKATELFKE
jgi:hypothetical protein